MSEDVVVVDNSSVGCRGGINHEINDLFGKGERRNSRVHTSSNNDPYVVGTGGSGSNNSDDDGDGREKIRRR